MQNSGHLRPEWQILKTIAAGIENDTQKNEIIELFKSEQFNWGELIEQALHHRVMPLVAHVLLKEIETDELFIPVKISQLFEQCLDLNIHKTKIYRREAAKVGALLQQNNIIFAGTKGIAYESTLYDANGTRYLGDIDFMIRPSDFGLVSKLLAANGYPAGEYDEANNVVIPHPREKQISYKLHPDHLLPVTIVTNDQFFKSIKFDVACSFTWHNSEFNVDMNEMLADTKMQPIPGHDTLLPVLNDENAFIFTILHLFREAWFFEIWNKIQQDVNLNKFRDVIMIYKRIFKGKQLDSLKEKIQKYSLSDPFYWVCYHLDTTFDFSLCKELDLHLSKDTSFLNSAYSNSESAAFWKGTMNDRLFSKSKEILFE